MSSRYPFSAIVGQEPMKLALVLNAINPRLGGVLIRGQKGTAKSTAARSLAGVLPAVQIVDGCRFGCAPDATASRCAECVARGYPSVAQPRPAAFVELPVGATEDRVIGTLDLEGILAAGQRRFEPGLLARANRGLLYVDEVNLLPDHLVDTLLDAAAMGVNTVERDGVSFSHPAAFVLIGTMNPEEGDLRPQLLDRFALAVDVEGMPAPDVRAEVVRRRIAYEQDPVAFAALWRASETAASARIRAAQALLPQVEVADAMLELIARICTTFEVDGLRADIVTYKAAATLAAYAERRLVTVDDVRRAAELALPHRRRRQPFDQTGLDHQRLDDVLDEFERSRSDAPPHSESPQQPDPPSHSESPQPADPPSPSVHSPRSDPPSTPRATPPSPRSGPPPPPRETPPAAPETPPRPSAAQQTIFDAATAPDLELPNHPSGGFGSERMDLSTAQSRHRATLVPGPRGRHLRSVATPVGTVDILATLRQAALRQATPGPATPGPATPGPAAPALRREDLRYKLRAAPAARLTLFVVDASGSMAARERMALAKGAILRLLLRAYQTRDEVALLAFRGATADVLLPPTSSVHLASSRLRELPTGGRTPLALALRAAARLLHHTAQRHATHSQRLVLISDGRANVPLSCGGDAYADALAAARELSAPLRKTQSVMIDTEDGPVRLRRAAALATALGATYLRLAPA